jgi:hypothetical protein
MIQTQLPDIRRELSETLNKVLQHCIDNKVSIGIKANRILGFVAMKYMDITELAAARGCYLAAFGYRNCSLDKHYVVEVYEFNERSRSMLDAEVIQYLEKHHKEKLIQLKALLKLLNSAIIGAGIDADARNVCVHNELDIKIMKDVNDRVLAIRLDDVSDIIIKSASMIMDLLSYFSKIPCESCPANSSGPHFR